MFGKNTSAFNDFSPSVTVTEITKSNRICSMTSHILEFKVILYKRKPVYSDIFGMVLT